MSEARTSNQQLRWRKKPVVIEAWRFDPTSPPTEVPSWVPLSWFAIENVPEYYPRQFDGKIEVRYRKGSPIINVPTLEGTMTARIGDWIIRGVKGEVYPCKPDIFEATYEPAGDSLEQLPRQAK